MLYIRGKTHSFVSGSSSGRARALSYTLQVAGANNTDRDNGGHHHHPTNTQRQQHDLYTSREEIGREQKTNATDRSAGMLKTVLPRADVARACAHVRLRSRSQTTTTTTSLPPAQPAAATAVLWPRDKFLFNESSNVQNKTHTDRQPYGAVGPLPCRGLKVCFVSPLAHTYGSGRAQRASNSRSRTLSLYLWCAQSLAQQGTFWKGTLVLIIETAINAIGVDDVVFGRRLFGFFLREGTALSLFGLLSLTVF